MQTMELRLGTAGEVYRKGAAGKLAWAAKGLAGAGAALLATTRRQEPRRGRAGRRARLRGRAVPALDGLQGRASSPRAIRSTSSSPSAGGSSGRARA